MAESWWIKVDRADKHIVELDEAAREYDNSHPYETVRLAQPKTYQHIGRYALNFTSHPDEMIAAIIGDCVHNLRSAMDHIVVRSTSRVLKKSIYAITAAQLRIEFHSRPSHNTSPDGVFQHPARTSKQRQSANWPLLTDNLWARDAHRRYVVRDPERRRSYRQAIEGLSDSKRAIIKNSQPYIFPNPHGNILAIVSRIDNADKHKQLTVTGAGLTDASYRATPHGWTIQKGLTRIGQFLEDGAIVEPVIPGGLGYPEMDVEFSGTATIHIKLAGVGGNKAVTYNMLPTLAEAIKSVRAGLTVFEGA